MPTSRRQSVPDRAGHFGPFGGKFVPETVMGALEELERAWHKARRDVRFRRELNDYLHSYAVHP